MKKRITALFDFIHCKGSGYLILWLLVIHTVFGLSVVKGQPPSRDNFNFLFENDFEDDQSGDYTGYDYCDDWNLTAYTDFDIDIITDANNKVMRGNYAEGSYSTTYSVDYGFCFRSYYPDEIADTLEEVYFSYDTKFKPGFEWVHGGKMPGLQPDPDLDINYPVLTTDAWSVRPMWSDGGELVAYLYDQDRTSEYGRTFDANYTMPSGIWINITIRMVLNTPGENDGIVEFFVNGVRVYGNYALNLRGVEANTIDNMYLASFFGGNTPDFAATRDETIDFDNFVSWTYSSEAEGVPRGLEAYPANQTLLHPYYSFIIVDHPVITVPSGLGDTCLIVTSSVDWSVSESVSWLTALKVNNDTLKISYDKNPGGPRQGKITLSGNGGKDVVVAVSQHSAPTILAKTIKINMYHKGYPAGTGWNDFSDWSAGSSLLLNDSLGNFSGYTIYNEDAWSGSNIYGMASGPYPQNVNKSYWLYSSGTTVDIEFRNLNDAHGYSLEFYGSIASGEKRQDRVTIGSKYDIIDVKSNTSDKAIFTSLSPSSGTIRASLTVESGGFGHLNAIVLREYKYDLELKSETSLQQSPPVVYPNPINDFLQIRNTENVTRVELINIYGKTLLVKQNQKASTIRIDTKALKDGIYILTLFYNSGTVSSVKVVK